MKTFVLWFVVSVVAAALLSAMLMAVLMVLHNPPADWPPSSSHQKGLQIFVSEETEV